MRTLSQGLAIGVVVVGLVLSGRARAAQPPCVDKDAWADWQAKLAASAGKPIEREIRYLYNLRRFLCAEVDAGRLTETEANPLFEGERQRLVKRAQGSQGQSGA